MKRMKLLKLNFIILLLVCVCLQPVKSQNTLSPAELETLLQKAERESQKYSRIFQNLSAEETKINLRFKNDGTVDEKRVIKSIFVAYQSPNSKSVQEFRNVIEFNGKNVTRSDKDTAEFFAKLTKAATSEAEYKKIRDDSLRYDGKRITWGMTLSQPRPFSEKLRRNFQFRAIGKEQIEGRNVWIIEYEQVKNSPYILSNPTADEPQEKGAMQYNMPISDALRPSNPLMKGKIWLDAETGQIRRNEFKIILHPAKLSRPLEASEFLYEYQPGELIFSRRKNFSFAHLKLRVTTIAA